MTLQELEGYFLSADLPQTISIKQGEKITDVRAFLNSHFQVLRANPNTPCFSAFYDRLYLLWEKLESEKLPL